MDVNKVLETMKIMTCFEDSESETALSACSAAAAEISSRLRSGISQTEHESRLIFTAAALAAYKYRLLMSARDDFSVFKAGEVSVTKNTTDAVSGAKRLYTDSAARIADLLEDNDFMFRRT